MIDAPRRPGSAAFERTPSPLPTERPAARSSFAALTGGRTPLDGGAAARCLAAAWREVLGEAAPHGALRLLWAQWALETAQGRAMRGNNFGGIKASRGGALYPTTEGFGASRVRVLGRFRTYATPEEGARDHVTLLARRFPLALEALRRGDASGFVAALARGGYFTAEPEAYRREIERLADGHARAPAASGVTPSALGEDELVNGVLASLRARERA
ncbi:MAG TPA: glucosaminidase domain-containing protein [Polyangiaceae bacterium]|nr:glucosaminidase domain-containing protein [Polyangiaceae bacterium]